MGLMLVTAERMDELENEVESYKRGYEKMTKEHETMQRWYRELRDSKDREIENLHVEIEDLKRQIATLRYMNGQLRQAVKWYEVNKDVSSNSDINLLVH